MSDAFEPQDHPSQLPLHAQLHSTVQEALAVFPTASLLHRVRTNTLLLAHCHALLISLFHVAHLNPHNYARARRKCGRKCGRNCGRSGGALRAQAQAYLQRRADAAKDHSQLILNDLANTRYAGPDIRVLQPPACALPLIGLLSFVSNEAPVCALAVICVLDAINFTHRSCFRRLQYVLHLSDDGTRYLSAAAGQGCVERDDAWLAIANTQTSADEQAWMNLAASSAGRHCYGLFECAAAA